VDTADQALYAAKQAERNRVHYRQSSGRPSRAEHCAADQCRGDGDRAGLKGIVRARRPKMQIAPAIVSPWLASTTRCNR
jgi:hypothetical protein